MRQKSALDYALRYAAEGFEIIWCPAPGTTWRGRLMNGKTTIARWVNGTGTSLKSSDPAMIAYWANRYSGCNFMLIVGPRHIVLDTDSEEADAALKHFKLPKTRTHQSGSGRGYHYFYRLPLEHCALHGKVKGVEKLDVKYGNALIGCPGNAHPSGGTYKITRDTPIAELSAAHLAKLFPPPDPCRAITHVKAHVDLVAVKRSVTGLIDGQGRKRAFFAITMRLLTAGYAGESLVYQMYEVNSAFGEPLTAYDVDRIISAAIKTFEGAPK